MASYTWKSNLDKSSGGLTGLERYSIKTSTINANATANIPNNAVITKVTCFCEFKQGYSSSKGDANIFWNSSDSGVAEIEPWILKGNNNVPNSWVTISADVTNDFYLSGENIGHVSRANAKALTFEAFSAVIRKWYIRHPGITWEYYIPTYKLTVTAGTGGMVSGGGTYESGTSATINAMPNTGYRFVKWSDGNTNATRTITVTADASYTAMFATDSYVTYDSIFSFQKWKNNGISKPSRAVDFSFIDNGFRVTAKEDDCYSGYSHIFSVEAGKTYTFEYDTTGGTSRESFVFFHDASDSYSWTKLSNSTKNKWNFTVPNGYKWASIRVDVNKTGDTISFSNFRIYPAGRDYMSNTVPAAERTDVETLSIPTPQRQGYSFQGWNTKPDGSGVAYTASNAFPTSDTTLYSQWKENPPKIISAQLIYSDKQISTQNKVPAGQSFIIRIGAK